MPRDDDDREFLKFLESLVKGKHSAPPPPPADPQPIDVTDPRSIQVIKSGKFFVMVAEKPGWH